MNNQQVDTIVGSSNLPKGQLSEKQVTGWLQEIATAKKREKAYRTDAQKIVALYEGYKVDQSPFNILYSNTETLAPALYNNTPRPAAGRRFKDKDPLGAAASLTMNRTLSFTMDSNNGEEAEFDTLTTHAVLQALVPGRGIVRWKYEADIEEYGGAAATAETKAKDIPNTPAEGEAAQELDEDNEAAEAPEDPQESPLPEVKNERVCGEMVEWDRWTCGYAKKWNQVPWISFEHHMVQEEVEDNFGKEIADAMKYAELDQEDEKTAEEDRDKRKIAVIYEVWNRTDKSVMFVSPSLKDREVKMSDDPLNLSGFYPMDEPLHFLAKISGMVPQPIYNLYRTQAEELNLVTRRITAVTEMLKVRGAYDSTLTEFAKIAKLDDGEMVAIDNIAMLGEGAKLTDYLYLMPLGELVNVLQQLYVQRTAIKTVIYEITGISDILRGSSVASETATAQNIKNQWGTLRLKAMQKRVQKWARNNVRIMAEIACAKFSVDTFKQITALPFVTKAEHDQAAMQMQQFQQQQQAAAMAPPQPAAPGQPPAAPPAPAQPPQQVIDTLATPVWEEVIALLKSTINREFRVDIELNSTIADDMAEDQKNIGELLNALSQFLNGVAPLIQNGAMPFEVAKTMMLGIVRKMAMGPEIEDQLEKMTAPKPPAAEQAAPPPPPDPNIQLKAQAEAQKIQLDMQRTQLKMEQSKQDAQNAILEAQLRATEIQNKMKVEEQKRLVNEEKFKQQMALAQQKTSQPQPAAGA